MALSSENRQKVIAFLLDTEKIDDDEVDNIFLDIYQELSIDIKVNNYETFMSQLCKKMLEYFEDEQLFKGNLMNYSQIKQSLYQWDVSKKALEVQIKLPCIQGALLDILDQEYKNFSYLSYYFPIFNYISNGLTDVSKKIGETLNAIKPF